MLFSTPAWTRSEDQDLRRVLCYPLHHRDPRADDWIRTSFVPLTRRTPFSVEPRRLERGIRRELNPYLLLHRQACLPRTPRTPYRAEGEGVEPSRPRSSTGFQPGPVALRVALPFVSSPTRTRTWNTSLEARDDVHFTIEPYSGRHGI